MGQSSENSDQNNLNDGEVLNSKLEEYRQKIAELTHLSEMGRLSAGILHEIRNPVNFINNFSKVSRDLVSELTGLYEKPPAEWTDDDHADFEGIIESLTGNLEKINENGHRLERIIRGMLGQLRGESPVFVSTNLAQLLEEYSKLAYQSARADDKNFNVTLNYDFDSEIQEINMAQEEFGRVVLNLVNNACYAINQRLKLGEPDYSPYLSISTKKTGQEIEIRIGDNGIGINPENLSKLFDAFFTTKPVGEGTGLGLSITYKTVVETHGGRIDVRSEPMKNTEFIISLPNN